MALQTDHEIIGVIENMAYFESEKTGEKEYVFGRGGGEKLAENFKFSANAKETPMQQPDWNEDDFAPSVYGDHHPIGRIYQTIAEQVLNIIPVKA